MTALAVHTGMGLSMGRTGCSNEPWRNCPSPEPAQPAQEPEQPPTTDATSSSDGSSDTSSPSVDNSGSSCTASVQQATDLLGGDLSTDAYQSVGSWEECCSVCNDNGDCLAWWVVMCAIGWMPPCLPIMLLALIPLRCTQAGPLHSRVR